MNFSSINNFLARYSKAVITIIACLFLLFSFLLFDTKISDGGDDSAYILRAYHIANHFEFPKTQAPLYPLVLSPIIKIAGINLPLLKLFSLLCLLLFTLVFYKTLKNFFSPLITFSCTAIISVNYYILYFGSQTYSEAFFLLMQGILFYVLFRFFIGENSEEKPIKKDLKKHLLLGFLLVLIYLTKNIGLVSAFIVLFYFLINAKWRNFFFTAVSFLLFAGIFILIKRIIFHDSENQLAVQTSQILQKDFYNPSAGNADLGGFIERFTSNSRLYFSNYFYLFFGVPAGNFLSTILTIFTYILLIGGVLFSFRKNKFLLFAGLYVLAMCATTFLVAHKNWGQWRLMIIYFPYILLFLTGSLYFLFEKQKMAKVKIILPMFLGFIFIATIYTTISKACKNTEPLKKNLSGDRYYGKTNGWKNFLKMSEYAAQHVPKDQKIMSRKAEMSFIYTEREFYPLYKVPSVSVDSLLILLKKENGMQSFAVSQEEIFRSAKTENICKSLRKYITAVVTAEALPYSKNPEALPGFIFSVPKNRADSIFNMVSAGGISFDKGIEALLKKKIWDDKKMQIFIPDLMLAELKKNKVTYAISGNISSELNGQKITGQFNSVQIFLQIIELKYPIIAGVHKIGANPDDEAVLIKIKYELLEK